QVIELGSAYVSGALDFDFGDPRGMQWENAFHSLPIGDSANGESRVKPGPTPADNDAGKKLDPFLVTFHHASVNPDRVTDFERRDLGFELLLLNLVNDIHTILQAVRRAGTTNAGR